MMIRRVMDASYIKAYQLQVLFDDHRKGTIDLEQVIVNDHRPIFRELTDLKKIKKFHIAMDTIVWENGLDLAPEFLYDQLVADKTPPSNAA